ncbi:MAG: pirin family protein [Rhodocyclaceae bacterium]|nr:pirin family protein [Rhodocyclaceae bacterium]MCB1961694.1 pirin family protein [Rhodocyclaceae bacterium]
MIEKRSGAARGQTRLDWLDSRHSFSFAGYHDPARMGWGPLRVINDDRIAPAAGFEPHGHRDMEIITYVVDGALAHRDSLGNGTDIRAGEVQRMSAGRGVRHSEFNALAEAPTRLLQIWIVPAATDLAPGYAQQAVSPSALAAGWALLVSGDGREGSLTLNQHADIHAARPRAGQVLTHRFAPGRLGYLQVVSGQFALGDLRLEAGDGVAMADEAAFTLTAQSAGECLLFDLPPGAR